jgi:formylglycine-generating enzyme required for sulfatase activity
MPPKSFIAILLMSLAQAPQDAPRSKPASGIEFVKITAGEFVMGDADGEDNEKPAHRVVISRGFEMGKYEVTQVQWEAVMGSNPSKFKGADLPVEQVSWEDAQAFLKALNAKNDGYV